MTTGTSWQALKASRFPCDETPPAEVGQHEGHAEANQGTGGKEEGDFLNGQDAEEIDAEGLVF